jgi:hypothetical protein
MEFEPVDITQLVVTIISVGGTIYIEKIKQTISEPKPPDGETRVKLRRLTLIMWVCIAIAIINSVIFGWRSFRINGKTNVAITYPANLDEVNQIETIRGSVNNLPAKHEMIVAVFLPEVERFYPQDQPITFEAGDKWSGIVCIGTQSDIGKKFDLIIIMANEEAQISFQAYFIEGRIRESWAGLDQLPDGAVIYDRITVTRK